MFVSPVRNRSRPGTHIYLHQRYTRPMDGYSGQMLWEYVDSTCLFNSFKDMVFLWKTIASFRHLKIFKHVTPSPEMYVYRICRQPMKWWQPTAHSEQYDLSGNFTVAFPFLKFSVEVGKTKTKNKRTNTWQTAWERSKRNHMLTKHANE